MDLFSFIVFVIAFIGGLGILVGVTLLKKAEPNPDRMFELKELSGWTYEEVTRIAILLMSIGWIGIIAHLVVFIFGLFS